MRKLFLTFTVLLAFMMNAFAQDRTITGKVTDEKGSPISGVSITAAGGKGTKTDASGNYSITVGPNSKTIVFSSVNFDAQTQTIGNATTINVLLKTNDTQLSEVVVVGYGVQQKKAFTGSSSKIDSKPIAQLVTPSFDKQLAGRASGVSVTNNSGQVNAPARIRIRGFNTINQNASPLIVVDGTPIITGNTALISNSNQLGDINPEDIERIDVLKDGASTAIYGSRGSGGVILITTKKGTRGRTAISYNGTYGFARPMQRFDLLNAQQFVTLANEKFTNAGQLPPARYDGTETDWQSNILVTNGIATTHTLSVSGGTDKSLFYLSLNYADNKGIIRTNRSTAFRIKTNIETQANSWLKIGNNLGVSRQNDFDQNNGSNALSGSVVGAIRALPNVPIYNPAHPTGYNLSFTANALGLGPNLRSIDDNYTNIAFVLDKNRNQSDQYRLLDNAFVELTLAKGLKTHSQIGIDYYTDNSSQILDPRHGDGNSSNGVIFQGQQNILNTNIQNYVNYNLSIQSKHNIFLTAGHELQQTTSRFYAAQGINISDIFYLKENIITNTAGTPSISGSYDKTAFESLFGRINYDYKSKYFLQGSIRRDGQSSLGSDYRYGTFPGVSVGWRLSEEKAWQKSPFLRNNISDFKIKASYAEVGNRIGGYPYLSTYGSRPYGNLGGLGVAAVGNPILQWETNKKTDVGIELNLLKNRVSFTGDYFNNQLDKLILAVPTPFSAGVPNNSISQNIGTAENKGIELSIDIALVQSKDFRWNVNANYTKVKNKLLSLYSIGGIEVKELPIGNYNINRVGESLNSIYGYEFAGVNSGNGNPVYYNAKNELVQRNVGNGGYFFANSLSDPAYGAATTLTVDDKRILGSAQPTFFGGFNNTFAYKGLTLDFLFRYGGGNKIVNITRQEILLNQKFANSGTEILNRWTTPGQITDVPKLWYANDAIVNQNGEAISRFVESGNFLRLQNISLSYDFNSKDILAASRNAIKSLRFFVQIQNAAVWTKYRGIDPEAFTDAGQDNSVSPQVRNLSFGLSLGL
jgi:TonB-dependent starch-binding outer membrane protein SusC